MKKIHPSCCELCGREKTNVVHQVFFNTPIMPGGHDFVPHTRHSYTFAGRRQGVFSLSIPVYIFQCKTCTDEQSVHTRVFWKTKSIRPSFSLKHLTKTMMDMDFEMPRTWTP